MLDLTFGEQVKIILKRKGMTIKELAKLIEEQTGREDVPSEYDAETESR